MENSSLDNLGANESRGEELAFLLWILAGIGLLQQCMVVYFICLFFLYMAALSIGLHVFFRIMFFFFLIDAQDPMVVLFLVLGGISILVSIVVVPIYIPTNTIGELPFLHTSPAFMVCRLSDDGHSDWCEVVLHYSFDLRFSDN